jgi:hypothetical protein
MQPQKRVDRSIWSTEVDQSRYIIKESRPDSRASRSSLQDLVAQAVHGIEVYQETAADYLKRIYDIVIEPKQIESYEDFERRTRRSAEFASVFVRNHISQIGHLVSNLLSAQSTTPLSFVLLLHFA